MRSPLSCSSAITVAPLPTWARAGFTPPDQPAHYAVGVNGAILGVVFGDPLRAPPVEGRGNKILWLVNPRTAERTPAQATSTSGAASPALRIQATLNGTDLAVDRELPAGPGPSTIDLPRPGCWTLQLSWSGHSDRLALPYS